VPITSSQSWCSTWPNERNVVLTPRMMALSVRLRRACCPVTRATTPNFCQAETLLTASILTASGDTITQRLQAENRSAVAGIQTV